jgi:UPF0755 protein
MALGSDVTFKYAFHEGLCDVDAPECDSTYNTRQHSGLPPGPIGNVDSDGLIAAAVPTDSNFFYFVSGDDGKTYFSETVDQHNAAVAAHCDRLCR